MESPEFSVLSSLRGELKSEDYIQPHYKETYRLAIDCLASRGRDSYQEFLKGERIGSFLSEDELHFITENVEHLSPPIDKEENNSPLDTQSSSGTYWPLHSDVDAPDLEMGWPEILHEKLQTNIDLLFHPPRQNNPTIKEVIRKHIQDARQVIAIAMDVFTDVDIFKEAVDASIRGVPVYVLLDDSHLKSFLTMAENQDVKIQQLRNMRVRTVKGQDYLCRSGAKFHGAMEQKFLLVDCLTAIYGSYGYTWSYEKINLSMVQVIKGLLVKSYDEEFRTLYARSTVPAELCPPEGLFQRNGPHGWQVLPNSHSAQKIERRDQLRHTLDTVYRKTCERKLGARNHEERLYEEEPNDFGPFIDKGVCVQNQMPQFQSTETMNFLKRHSYAGERQDECTPQNIRPRASNWNISRESGNGTNHYATDNYLQVPLMHRSQNIRQSYNGNDKQILSMQQNMPTLENTSKSFMRTLRIESYLNNPDDPFGDSCDYLDQVEPQDKANSFMQARMRSSLAYRPTIPEQMEPYRHNSFTGVNNLAAPNSAMHYSSMQWNPTADNRLSNEEFMSKRQLEENCNSPSYGPGRTSQPYQSVYTSLGRAKGGHMIQNPDIMTDSWHKRHSVADPRSNTEYAHEPSGQAYGAFAGMQVNRSATRINAQSGGYGSNLNEDQRSASHYDVKNMTHGTKSPGAPWQNQPCRAVSAAALDVKGQDSTPKSDRPNSQHFLKNSSNKIKSLLHIPEKKEGSVGTMGTLSLTSSGSNDTLTAEDEERISHTGERHPSTSSSVRSSVEQQRRQLEDDRANSPKHGFRNEEQQNPSQASLPKPTTQKKSGIFDRSARPIHDSGSWSKDRSTETRLYSRFEPFCSFEKKQSLRSAHSFGKPLGHSQEKTKALPKGEASIEHNITRAARGHPENKLEKFFHRVGNFIHKNK